MTELAVYSDTERERIRDELKHFRSNHGKLGDFKLYGLMYDVLDPQHHVYLSQSTMQRFMRNKGRTTDEGVWAIKTFLDRVAPPGGLSEIAKAIADQLCVPVFTVPPVFAPLETYQGLYELYLRTYTGEFFETKFSTPDSAEFIMFNSSDPRYLQIWTHDREDRMSLPHARFFLRCGLYQFLLMSTGLGGEASFTLLSHIEDDPLVLQGTMMQTANDWPPREPSYEFRLVRLKSLKREPKSRPGQYGSRTKKPSQ